MSDLISRQEVIIALRESGLCYNNWLEVLGVIDAVPNAKEHIKNGDLIRRQDVLDMIIVAGECEPGLGYTHLHEVVENIPSADRPIGWIPVKWHEITDEEREREGYPKDWVVHIDCEMPCDEQEILVTTRWGTVEADVCYEDGEFSLDSGYDWIDDIIAWMPLPEPYEGGEKE